MDATKRSFFKQFTLAFGSVVLLAKRGAGAPASQEPAPMRVPVQPRRGQDFPPSPPQPDPHAILKQNEKDLKKDVQKLFELAEELKKEVEKTDSSEVLSLNLIRKAGEIEKLAKHIKSLAAG